MTLLTPDDLTNINKQPQEADSAVRTITELDIDRICEKHCIYEHFMLGKNGVLVPVGEQVLSTCSDHGKFYEEPGIEILLYRGKNTVFTLISWGKDKEEAEAKKCKGLSVLKERLSEGINSITGKEIEKD
jgi:carbamoylphosphate synthase large subunit